MQGSASFDTRVTDERKASFCPVMQRRRTDDAFAAITRSLVLAPNRRAEILADKDLAPLHADPRWSTSSEGRVGGGARI